MTNPRILPALALAGLALVLSGCGSEDATDPGSGTVVEGQPDTPEIASDTGTDADRSADALGTVVLNEKLGVDPAEYPLPDAPTQAEVASVAELGEVYATVPGIEDIVAGLEGTTLESGERMFVYLVNACTTKEVALSVDGDQVPMIVTGTKGLRCAPPTTMVVWVVGDEIPADAMPARAIQQ